MPLLTLESAQPVNDADWPILRPTFDGEQFAETGCKMRHADGVILGVAFACVSGCAGLESEELTVSEGRRVAYECEHGDRIVAKYYSLSDGSLHFVKLSMPGGKEHTLPNAVSASGARYTDDFNLVWWVKGDSAMVETIDRNGAWQITHHECKEAPEK